MKQKNDKFMTTKKGAHQSTSEEYYIRNETKKKNDKFMTK
jgi:hypothetical protein